MKILSNSPSQTIVFSLLSLLTYILPLSATIILSSQITYNNEVTVAPIEGVLCVPPGAHLVLNCTISKAAEWESDSDQYPVISIHSAGVLATISSFSDANSGLYTCSYNGEKAVINVTTREVASAPNPQRYEVIGDSSVTLSACVSAYPSLKSGLVVRWSSESGNIPSCSSQGSVGCFECNVPVGSLYSERTFSFDATTQSYSSSQQLSVIVHQLPLLESPLSQTTQVVECVSATLSCSASGDPDIRVDWQYGSATLSSSDGITITTSYDTDEDTHYTSSSLKINEVDGTVGGEYSCVFHAYGEETNTTSTTQVQVIPQLCIERYVDGGQNVPIPANSVSLLQGSPDYMYVCTGSDVTWYHGDEMVPELRGENTPPIYQIRIGGSLFLYLTITPPPSFFDCRSPQAYLQTWIYLTSTHPTVVAQPTDVLSLKGSNVSINAYLSPTQDSYTLSWRYILDDTLSDVTELGWTYSQDLNSISLVNLEDMHSGVIQLDYRTGGEVANTTISVMTLSTPDLYLSHPNNLSLWEGSRLQVNCSLKVESLAVTVSPEWEGVASCPSVVCSDNSSLILYNLTEAVQGKYTCKAGNEAGEKQTSLNLDVMPFSDDLISLSFQIDPESPYMQADTLTLNASSTTTKYLRLSCSLNNSVFSTEYLPVSEPTWTYNSSLQQDTTVASKTSLLVDIQSVFRHNQRSLFSSHFCCQSTLDIYRVAEQCISVTFNADMTSPDISIITNISILLLLDNCTLLTSPDPLTPIKLALLQLIRANCSCNVSEAEMNLTEHFCHSDYISNHPSALLTLCGTSTEGAYALLLNASMNRDHISVEGRHLTISSVKSDYQGTHCSTEPPPTLPPTGGEFPIWTRVVLFGALPMLIFMLVLLFISIFCFLCYTNLSKSSAHEEYAVQTNISDGQNELTNSDNALHHSSEPLTSSMMTLSPSLLPTATNRLYHLPLSPQELLSRPASTPPSQGEFPVMFSNPLAFEGSGESYSTSFSNFNNNHSFCSDMPPISETARRMPPVYASHRLLLHYNYSNFARDHAHSSLPSPLRSARRHQHREQTLHQYRNRSVTPTNSHLHHQLKLSQGPSSILRTETPTFDSGVEELESINPRSSSSASSQVSEEMALPRGRSTSLATPFPQHMHHFRVPSMEEPRNTSLPNITDVGVDAINSHGLELYKTVKKGQQVSQTLV